MPAMGLIHFRLATSQDIDALIRMRIAFLSEIGQTPDDATAFKDALRNYFTAHLAAADFVSCLAESDGEIIATSGMVFHIHPPSVKNPNGRGAHIMNMYTLPGFRGQGIATKLLRQLLDIARQRE